VDYRAAITIRPLLPACVAVREAADAEPWQAGLLGGEDEAVARAVPRRRAEFEAGRSLARAALADLGLPPVPIPTGTRREPRWPDGVVGSITHCAGHLAAAVAHRHDVLSLGIDAERRGRVTAELLDHIATDRERAWCPGEGDDWPTALFAVKEAIFKAWYPVRRRWLGFADAEVDLDLAGTRFRARLPGTADPVFARLAGRVLVGPDHVFAAVAVAARRLD
jgi:4'-phosphopantetheinyl transferase EntD